VSNGTRARKTVVSIATARAVLVHKLSNSSQEVTKQAIWGGRLSGMAAEVWGGKVETLTAGTQYRHLCLEVTGLDEYCKTLKGRGVSVTEITMGMDNSRQAWVTDPDGNQIELMEYGPLSLQLTRKH
jgi:hypothetical protein